MEQGKNKYNYYWIIEWFEKPLKIMQFKPADSNLYFVFLRFMSLIQTEPTPQACMESFNHLGLKITLRKLSLIINPTLQVHH